MLKITLSNITWTVVIILKTQKAHLGKSILYLYTHLSVEIQNTNDCKCLLNKCDNRKISTWQSDKWPNCNIFKKWKMDDTGYPRLHLLTDFLI